ncbi:MAG TPA: hypothetical protein VGF73_12030 [Chthoniobacterales bacterium]
MAVFFVAFLASARAGVDFTPEAGERTLEGVVFKQIVFHQDRHRISYEQPRGWSYTGDAGSVRLTPPGVSQARATIEQSPLPAPEVFDDATTTRLRQQVLALAPSGAQNVTVVSEEKNPLRINQQDTYAVTVAYSFYGQDYELCEIFADLKDTQLRFRTVARKTDFEKMNRAFRASLFTLAWQ